MQNNTTIARPYALAVFEYARESGDMDKWSALLNRLSLIVQDRQMRLVLSSPKVSDEELKEILADLMGGELDNEGRNFIRILIQANRLVYVPFISDLFEKHRADAEGRMEINVHTAFKLDKKQESNIADVMGKRLGRQVTISSVVDESLIGGIIIRAGDSVIDASLRGRLTELKNSLTA
jgi:F-type H+-transporting ATPase subunit delta